MRETLLGIYERLRDARGHGGWWPGAHAFEVCVGAILVKNTAWTSVEKALDALRGEDLLSFDALNGVPEDRLAALLRPAGTYNVKARRLRAFLDFLGTRYGGRTEAMAGEDPARLREQLLEVPGIGRETADSIVLYAAGLPLFVVDAYTRRVFSRLGLLKGDEEYDAIQRFFMDALPREAALYNDYHAQIVLLAQDACRPKPLCGRCPLEPRCPSARP